MYIKEGKDFVAIKAQNGQIFMLSSGEEYFWEVLNDTSRIAIFDDGFSKREIKLPFSSAMMAQFDKLINYLLVYSDAHREVITSQDFAKMSIPMAKRFFTEKVAVGKTRGYIDLEEEYVPLMNSLFDVHAKFQYETVKRTLGITNNDTVLEIGGATGCLATMIAKDAKRVVSIDLSEPYNKFARNKAKEMGLDNCTFVTGSYPCETAEKFDYVLSFNFNDGQTYSNFRNHTFPGRKILLGGFRVKPASDEDEKNKIAASLANFKERYFVMPFKESREEIGKEIDMEFIYLQRKS